MIRKKIQEMYLNITDKWTDDEVLEYLQFALQFVPEEDVDENLDFIYKLKGEKRNEKIDYILKNNSKKVKKKRKGH